MVASLYGPDQERKSIWVFLEQDSGVLASVSLELVAKARELADEARWSLAGLLLGSHVRHLAQEAFALGVDQVWLAEHPLLETFTVEAYAQVAYQAIRDGRPSIWLLGATPNGRDLAGRLAVRLRTGLNADCTQLRLDTRRGVLTCEVTGFGGGVLALLEMPNHRPQMATVRPGVFPPGEAKGRRKGKVVEVPVALQSDQIHVRVVERVLGQGVDLARAKALVCGGRGMDGDFATLEQLARLLDAEVGATRPPVDEGHVGRERQVGQTGVVCRPKVAIACGISGAFHFVVGIQAADLIVAINSDPQAPIFEASDYCVVGDVHQVLPALMDVLRQERELAHA